MPVLEGVCNVMNIEIMTKNNISVKKKKFFLLKTVKMTIFKPKLIYFDQSCLLSDIFCQNNLKNKFKNFKIYHK